MATRSAGENCKFRKVMRYFVHIGYLGSQYRGWQRQANAHPSVQGAIEAAMLNMLGTRIGIIGCGRTDAGVHAQQFFFHFDTDIVWSYDFAERINYILPSDITVFDIIPVHEKAHARFDATSRTYEFYVRHDPHPYMAKMVTCYPIAGIDREKMEAACLTLIGKNDFAHLCISPLKANTTICDVTHAKLTWSNDGRNLVLQITANRFLKSMIRIIMARLIAVGEGQISLSQFVELTPNKELMKWKTMMHPQGLHLTRVVYPDIDIEPRSSGLSS